MRKQNRALRIGNFRLIEAERILAFERYTGRALETIVVLVNPSNEPVSERIMVANANLMDTTLMADLLSPMGTAAGMVIEAGFMTARLPTRMIYVLKPCEEPLGGYSRYKRVE